MQEQGRRPLPRSRPKFGGSYGGKTHTAVCNGDDMEQVAKQDVGFKGDEGTEERKLIDGHVAPTDNTMLG